MSLSALMSFGWGLCPPDVLDNIVPTDRLIRKLNTDDTIRDTDVNKIKSLFNRFTFFTRLIIQCFIVV